MSDRKRPPVVVFIIPLFIGLLGFYRVTQSPQFESYRTQDIPLTIADSDPHRGTITIIVQGVGKTTKLINMLNPGDAFLDVVGPLGKASEIQLFGTAARWSPTWKPMPSILRSQR